MISRTAQLPSSSTSLLDALMIPAILLAAIVTLVAIDFTQWRAFGMYWRSLWGRSRHVRTIDQSESVASPASHEVISMKEYLADRVQTR